MHLKTIVLRNIPGSSVDTNINCLMWQRCLLIYVTWFCIHAGANVTKNQTVAAIFVAELQLKNIDKKHDPCTSLDF